MGFKTKPDLVDGKFEQCIGDILTLYGCTQITGTMDIHPNGSIDSCNGYKISGTTFLGASKQTIDSVYIGNLAGSNGTGAYNFGVGCQTLQANTSGNNNIALGFTTMKNNTIGCYNSAIGSLTLYTNVNGNYNSAFGMCALYSNIDGEYNIAIGKNAMGANTHGNCNIAIGVDSLCNNTTGIDNIAVGEGSLASNKIGDQNIAIGLYALNLNTGGTYNIVLGSTPLFNNTNGSNNIALGQQTLFSNVSGSDNVGIGREAGKSTLGSNGVFIGKQAGCGETTSNKLHIANCNLCTLIYGDFATNVVTLPTLKLCTTPTGGLASDAVLVYEAASCTVKCITSSSLVSGGGAIITANNGLFKSGTNVRMGAPLTGDTKLTGAYTLSICDGAIDTKRGYQISGTTILKLATSSIDSIYVGSGAGLTGAGANNVGIGTGTLAVNTTGANNVALSYRALFANTTGCNNFALGSFAMCSNTSGCTNVGINNFALAKNTTGCNNFAIGINSLFSNVSGSNNIAIGDCAGYNNLGSCNIYFGRCAGYSNTTTGKLYFATGGTNNLIYGDFALNTVTIPKLCLCTTPAAGSPSDLVLVWNSSDKQVKCITASSLVAGSGIQTANNGLIKTGTNVRLGGDLTGNTSLTGSYRLRITGGTLISTQSGYQINDITMLRTNTTNDSVYIGSSTGNAMNNAAANNVIVGSLAMMFNGSSSSCNNTAVGMGTMVLFNGGELNTALGAGAGGGSGFVSGSRNLFLGTSAGYNESGSDKLHISNCGICTLIYGDFAAKCVQIGGQLKVTGVTAGNTGTDCVVMWNPTDKLFKQVTSASLVGSGGGITTANNGLFKSGTNVRLGGLLTGNTSITGAYTLCINNGAKLNSDCGYQISGQTMLRTAPNDINSIYIGCQAGGSGDIFDNIGIGSQALMSATGGGHNVAIGCRALMSSTGGGLNIAIGGEALYSNICGGDIEFGGNIAIGNSALYANTCGGGNIAIGHALGSNTCGHENVAIGDAAMSFNDCGGYNVAIGRDSMCRNRNGSYNVAVGYQALYCNCNGTENIAIGCNAGWSATGTSNIFIGTCAGYNVKNGNNKLYIASGVSRNLIYGDFVTNEVTLPTLKLCTTPATGSVSTDVLLVWNPTDKKVKCVAASTITPTSSICTMELTGNGTATGFTLNHALNVAYPIVQVVKKVSPYPTVYTDVSRPNANCVCVTFDVAPANGLVYEVLIIK